jgi:hypothetical protein
MQAALGADRELGLGLFWEALLIRALGRPPKISAKMPLQVFSTNVNRSSGACAG